MSLMDQFLDREIGDDGESAKTTSEEEKMQKGGENFNGWWQVALSEYCENEFDFASGPNGTFQLSDCIFLTPNKKVSNHENVFEGEIRSGVFGVRPCVVKFAQRLEEVSREAKILTKLGSHTQIVSIIQSGVFTDILEENHYLVLDRCNEHNLNQYLTIRRNSGLEYDSGEALNYCQQIIEGIKYVHENLIIHKDLKPSNILLSLDRRLIKLADFGLSEETKSASSRVFSKHQFGTDGFRPFESFGNSWISLKSDIFSLAVVFYHLLSNGESPFGKDPLFFNNHVNKGIFDVSNMLVPNAKTTEHLLSLMLSKERCRRPSIWQVTEHPCWTGNEAECDFDYGWEEETVDCQIENAVPQIQESQGSVSDDEDSAKLAEALKKIALFSASDDPTNDAYVKLFRPRARESLIIICDNMSKHFQGFNPKQMTLKRMHEFNNNMKIGPYSAVSLDGYIYILGPERSLCRLKYSDAGAEWERLEDMLENDHGSFVRAVAIPGAIYVIGGSIGTVSKATSMYVPETNGWAKLTDKNNITGGSAVAFSQKFVYCIGGENSSGSSVNWVEKFTIHSHIWSEVSPMQTERLYPCATQYKDTI